MTASGWRSVAALLAVTALAGAAFAWVSEGFYAVTSDGVRRANLARMPRALPDIVLVDAFGQTLSLQDYGSAGEATFVTLQYVRCRSVCLSSAAAQSWLQGELQARGLQTRVKLLTLSFDPHNDTQQVLLQHAQRLHADSGLWRFATVGDAQDLPQLLGLFDLVVLPDGLGGFSHNAALFLIGHDGRLSKAYDIDRPDIALADYLHSVAGS
jgi:protein SCO1/2